MMENGKIIGWDIGGANLKVVAINTQGKVIYVNQIESPIWKGLDILDASIATLPVDLFDHVKTHAITLTGELADIFPDRRTGVREIIKKITLILGRCSRVYAGREGWVDSDSVEGYEADIASANWHAAATWLADKVENGLLMDMGSTTTDIIPFIARIPDNRGYSDQERLCEDELVYTGVDRTSVTAVVQKLPLNGRWQQVANEYFSTMADIYCLTGDLPENAGFTTADGQGTTLIDCARRLARVAGADIEENFLAPWRKLARFVSTQQYHLIDNALSRVLSRYSEQKLSIIAAGAGRFVIRRIVERQNLTCHDFADFLQGDEMLKQAAAICAPAASCALLQL